MAAYAALVSVMQIIHEIENHPSPPIHLDKQQVESLTENVTFLQNFLEAYHSPIAHGDEVDPLEIRIADAAYAAEDAIDSYIMSISTTTHDQETDSSGEVSCINLYKVIEEMDLMKEEVATKIQAEKAVVNDQLQMKGSTHHAGSLRQWKDSMMVGFDNVLLEVLDKLVGSQLKNRLVIPISGMGGIGKTTLAMIVYSKPLIKEHFDIRAWITISQQYDPREILCEILSQTTYINKELSERGELEELGSELYKILFGRRFLIVMDDVWSIDAWDKIQRFFPDNENGSRILVTTRLSQLSSQLNTSYSLQMKFLDEASSWDLLCKTVFGGESCPLELEEVGKKIVENCKGLPLSIVVVGGLLRKMEDTVGCWESIWDNLSSMVNLENDKHCFKLLKMSYNNLPVYLKPCFLYMGVFEEDYEIGVSKLIKLWVSEGFLKPRSGKSLETIAREQLNDLVDRNLILAHEVGRTGNLKKCKIHDLLRDLCLTEARKYGFYHVIGQEHSPDQATINGHRRIVIPSDTSEEEVLDALKSMSHTRSIICDDDDKVMACRNSSPLLRTQNARNTYVDERDGSPLVFRFVNLRHVVVELYSKLSISHLWNLHTLIVNCWHECNAPVGIWRMRQLRHIVFRKHRLHLPDPPSNGDVVIMENLQTLKGVENFKCGEEVVKRIPNITRLLIKYDKIEGSNDNDYYWISNIGSLSRLESLTYTEGIRMHRVQKLTFPHSIKKLTLTMSYDDDMLEKIGSLPHLRKLKMISGSFTTGKWEIGEGQFPCLRSLTLMWCRGIKHWTAAEESGVVFPCLEQLYLSGLTGLKEIPYGIGDTPTLQTIELLNCSDSVVECAREIVDEQECYGEVSFRVSVVVSKKFEALKSLATPGFEVEVTDYV